MKKILLITVPIIIVVGIIVTFILLNKKSPMDFRSSSYNKYFETNVKAYLKDNKIYYDLDIKPKMKVEDYKDIKVKLVISGISKIKKGERELEHAIKYKTDTISISNKGIYKGTLESDIKENGVTYISAPEKIHVFARETSGTLYVKK